MNHTIKYLTFLFILFLSCEGPLFEIPKEEDITPPIITIVSPADQAVVSDTIQISIYASDNTSLTIVQLLLDDSTVMNLNTDYLDTSMAPYEYSWNTANYSEDEYHILVAKAVDSKDNENQTRPISVLVDNDDNIRPTGVLLYPFNGQTLAGTINIFAEATDNESVAAAIFFINGDTVAVDNDEPYLHEWDTTEEFDDLFYVIHVQIIDGNGNYMILGPISVYIDNDENVEEDNVPPTGSITYPPSSATVSGTVDIQIEAFDNNQIAHVDIVIDGSISIRDETEPYGYSWNTTTATEDTDHFITASVTDTSNNTTNLMPVTVFVNNIEEPDITPPVVVLTDPAASQTVSGVVTVRAEANDNQGIAQVVFFQNSVEAGSDTDEPYEYSWDTMQESDDSEHIWYAKAFDTSNLTAQTQAIAVYVDNDDDDPPTGFISQPYAGQTVSDTVEIVVSASDNVGVASVEFSINGSVVATDTDEPYSHLWNTLTYTEDDEHVISVKITDLAGNFVNLQPIAVTVNNDQTPSDDVTPPVIAILSPVSGMEVSDSVEIHIFAQDNSGIQSVQIYIDNSLASTVTDSPYIYMWHTYEYANESQHIIGATATDLSGNQTSAQSILVTVNNLYLGVVENLSVTQGVSELLLNWESPYDAEAFRIYRDDAFLAETELTNYTDTLVAPAVIHCYQVSPVNHLQIEGSLSSSVCEKALLPPPDNLSGSANQNSITLNWAIVTGADQYKLYRDGTDIYTGSNPTSQDTGLAYGTTYNFTVSSMDLTGDEGPQSDPLAVSTHEEVTAPTLVLTTDSTLFSLSWTTINVAVLYRIYKDDVFLADVETTTYSDTVAQGMIACYEVSAIDEHGTEGPQSNEECATSN